jgi:hypothetical protein
MSRQFWLIQYSANHPVAVSHKIADTIELQKDSCVTEMVRVDVM